MPDITTTDVNKIDAEAVSGLAGVHNSLAYKVHEIEKHFHGFEHWFGLAAAPSATNKADQILTGSLSPLQIDAGNDDWGTWVQILGSADTPIYTDYAYFDLHKVQINATGTADVMTFMQIGYGASGAAALTDEHVTTIAFKTPTNKSTAVAINFMMGRAPAGSLLWARCLAIGQNTMTVDFYFGIHEYVG